MQPVSLLAYAHAHGRTATNTGSQSGRASQQPATDSLTSDAVCTLGVMIIFYGPDGLTSGIGAAVVGLVALPSQDWSRLAHASAPVIAATPRCGWIERELDRNTS